MATRKVPASVKNGKIKDIKYTHYVPARVNAEGRVEYFASEDFKGPINDGGLMVPKNLQEKNPKFAKFFWSPNDAAAFCVLAGKDKWVVLKRDIIYKQTT